MRVFKRENLFGSFSAAPDKSITIRAVLLGAIAKGKTRIINPLISSDGEASISCAEKLGAKVVRGKGEITITGAEKILDGCVFDCKNSATTARLLAGILAGGGVNATITGDESLSKRPMERVCEPLKARGANIFCRNGRLPISIRPAHLKDFEYRMPVDSAQVKSAVLLSGLLCNKNTAVVEKNRTRNHTEQMLPLFGADLRVGGKKIDCRAGDLCGAEICVPADPSSAAYYLASGVLSGETTVAKVLINDTRDGFYKILIRAGAKIKTGEKSVCGGFCVADLTAEKSDLKYFEVEPEEIPSLVDELPLLAVVSAFFGGAKIKCASELRVKESDRLLETVRLINRAGGSAFVSGDNLIVEAKRPNRFFEYSSDDHRMTMTAFVLMSACAGGELGKTQSVEVSFPDFFKNFENFSACLFGRDVSKSYSGLIHKHNLENFGMQNFLYEMRSVTAEEFSEELKKPRYKLINATEPYKFELFNSAKKADFSAEACGSANFLNGGEAYSTDGEGLIFALSSLGVNLKNKNALVLGAGGAGRSVCAALALAGAKVFVWNRTREKAEEFCFAEGKRGVKIEVFERGVPVDFAIKTVSVDIPDGFDLNVLSGAEAVVDIRYNVKSGFLQIARGLGVKKIADGKRMLFFQAYVMDALICGKTPNFDEGETLLKSFTRKYPFFADEI